MKDYKTLAKEFVKNYHIKCCDRTIQNFQFLQGVEEFASWLQSQEEPNPEKECKLFSEEDSTCSPCGNCKRCGFCNRPEPPQKPKKECKHEDWSSFKDEDDKIKCRRCVKKFGNISPQKPQIEELKKYKEEFGDHYFNQRCGNKLRDKINEIIKRLNE